MRESLNDDHELESAVSGLMKEQRKLRKQASVIQRQEFSKKQRQIMKRVSRVERRCSELDTTYFPESSAILNWRNFNSDFKSTDRTFGEVAEVISRNLNERIDLRPYMILSPYCCMTTDKLQKVLDIFRYMQLRQMCVVNPIDGSLQGVISREDLFSFMSL